MMIEKNHKCSNLVTECVLEGVKEVIGPEAFEAVLDEARLPHLNASGATEFNAADIQRLQAVCVDRYGSLSARGMALRSGQSSFSYFLKQFGQTAGFEELNFRLLPPKRRIFSGLQRIADVFAAQCGLKISATAEGSRWIVEYAAADEDSSAEAEIPCGFIFGLLKEYLIWISGGKFFAIQETRCRANGDAACRFEIDQRPLD
jgi:predicted hydrocarbon binding protein